MEARGELEVQVRPGELERASVVHDEDRLSRALRVLQEESRAAPYHPDIYAPIGNAARSGGRGGRGSHAPRHVGGDWAPAYPGADRAAYGSPSIPVWSAGAHNGHPDALPAVPGVDGGRQGSPGRQAPVYVTYDTLPERKKRVTDELLRRALQPASPSRPGAPYGEVPKWVSDPQPDVKSKLWGHTPRRRRRRRRGDEGDEGPASGHRSTWRTDLSDPYRDLRRPDEKYEHLYSSENLATHEIAARLYATRMYDIEGGPAKRKRKKKPPTAEAAAAWDTQAERRRRDRLARGRGGVDAVTEAAAARAAAAQALGDDGLSPAQRLREEREVERQRMLQRDMARARQLKWEREKERDRLAAAAAERDRAQRDRKRRIMQRKRNVHVHRKEERRAVRTSERRRRRQRAADAKQVERLRGHKAKARAGKRSHHGHGHGNAATSADDEADMSSSAARELQQRPHSAASSTRRRRSMRPSSRGSAHGSRPRTPGGTVVEAETDPRHDETTALFYAHARSTSPAATASGTKSRGRVSSPGPRLYTPPQPLLELPQPGSQERKRRVYGAGRAMDEVAARELEKEISARIEAAAAVAANPTDTFLDYVESESRPGSRPSSANAATRGAVFGDGWGADAEPGDAFGDALDGPVQREAIIAELYGAGGLAERAAAERSEQQGSAPDDVWRSEPASWELGRDELQKRTPSRPTTRQRAALEDQDSQPGAASGASSAIGSKAASTQDDDGSPDRQRNAHPAKTADAEASFGGGASTDHRPADEEAQSSPSLSKSSKKRKQRGEGSGSPTTRSSPINQQGVSATATSPRVDEGSHQPTGAARATPTAAQRDEAVAVAVVELVEAIVDDVARDVGTTQMDAAEIADHIALRTDAFMLDQSFDSSDLTKPRPETSPGVGSRGSEATQREVDALASALAMSNESAVGDRWRDNRQRGHVDKPQTSTSAGEADGDDDVRAAARALLDAHDSSSLPTTPSRSGQPSPRTPPGLSSVTGRPLTGAPVRTDSPHDAHAVLPDGRRDPLFSAPVVAVALDGADPSRPSQTAAEAQRVRDTIPHRGCSWWRFALSLGASPFACRATLAWDESNQVRAAAWGWSVTTGEVELRAMLGDGETFALLALAASNRAHPARAYEGGDVVLAAVKTVLSDHGAHRYFGDRIRDSCLQKWTSRDPHAGPSVRGEE